MEEIKIDEIMDVIQYNNQPITELVKTEENNKEGIRIYVPPRRAKRRSAIIRFLFTTAVFFLLFLCLAMHLKNRQADPGEDNDGSIPTVKIPETTETVEFDSMKPATEYPPTVIDESKVGVEICLDEEYALSPLFKASDGVKVLIVHSHNSEYVSDSLTVTDAGNVITQLLTVAGIETYHCVTVHDADGNIGSYLKMKESVSSLVEKHPDAVCIIDFHDSDSGLPVTFTVGTDCVGWNENLRFAEAVCGKMKGIKTAFRFLPGALGQDSGVLTLNVGLGGAGFSDDDARSAIAAFANAFIEICNEKASAP